MAEKKSGGMVMSSTGQAGVDGLVPKPTPDTEPFWQGAKERELRVQRCTACTRFYFYPRFFCPHCWSTDVAWVATSGQGVLASFVINHRPVAPFPKEIPQIIALIELDEGFRMMSNIIGVDPDPAQLHIGARVTVDFVERGEFMLPVFRLAVA
jgi:uncharacterized protein